MIHAENDTVLNAEEREIARRLAELPAGEPPPELRERLKADVPEDLAERLAAAGDDGETAPPGRRRWLAAAAVVVSLVGGGWLAWSVWQVVPPAGEVVQERAAPAVEDADVEPKTEAPPAGERAGRQAAGPSEPTVRQAEARVGRVERRVQQQAARRAATPEPEAPLSIDAEPAPEQEEVEVQRVAPPEPEPPLPVSPFIATAEDRLSTFGLDVDTGSYTALRAALRDGRLPPPAWVRVEEMVNAYRYADPFAATPPEPGETFRVVAEGAPHPYAPGPRHRLLRFQVTARPVVPVERAFVEELTGTLQTVAEEARAQVEFDPRSVDRWRLLGYENRAIADERFRWDHTVDAGEIGAGQTVTVLYEVELTDPPPAPDRPLALLKLRWRNPGEERFREEETRLHMADLTPSWQAASAELRLAATVAELGEVLRGSPHAAELGAVLREARRLAGARPGDEQVAELVELADRAAELRRAPEEESGP